MVAHKYLLLLLTKTFLNRVNTNQISFSKGDILICEVRMIQTRGRDGLKTEYVVERVREHKPAARQITMPFDAPDDNTPEDNNSD